MKRLTAALCTTLPLLLLAGCIEQTCDSDQVVTGNTCTTAATPTTMGPSENTPADGSDNEDAGSPDSGPPQTDTTDETNDTDNYEGFGVVCSPDPGQPMLGFAESADCGGQARTCALVPNQPGLCTALNCLDDESICPPDWTCFDTSTVIQGQPSACTPPM